MHRIKQSQDGPRDQYEPGPEIFAGPRDQKNFICRFSQGEHLIPKVDLR